jgi:hypothetical protein
MKQQIATLLQRKAQLVLALFLLLSAVGVLTSGYTQERQLTLKDTSTQVDERTLKPKDAYKFELNSNRQLVVIDRQTNRKVVTVTDGPCTSCSNGKNCTGLVDMDGTYFCSGGCDTCKLK